MTSNPFNQACFLLGAGEVSQLPADTGREIAFAGRSNVGKSSVLNVITGNSRLARTSKTPGRTRELNCFTLPGDRRLIDLPGYGYARVPESVRRRWGRVMESYFNERTALCGLFLIMDVRHPLMPFDRQMLEWCHVAGLPVHVLLNKSDKLSHGAAAACLKKVTAELGPGQCSVQLFSALKRTGAEAARSRLVDWLRV